MFRGHFDSVVRRLISTYPLKGLFVILHFIFPAGKTLSICRGNALLELPFDPEKIALDTLSRVVVRASLDARPKFLHVLGGGQRFSLWMVKIALCFFESSHQIRQAAFLECGQMPRFEARDYFYTASRDPCGLASAKQGCGDFSDGFRIQRVLSFCKSIEEGRGKKFPISINIAGPLFQACTF